MLGAYGKSQQISAELEQVIETAGKRKKRVALRELEKQSATLDYEELLRLLKKDLRLAYHALNRILKEEQQLQSILASYSQLNEQYKRQSDLQNVAKADFYRIQTELISLQNEQTELENQKFDALTLIRTLTHQPDLQLSHIGFPTLLYKPLDLLPMNISEEARQHNIGLLQQENEIKVAENQLLLAKAERRPDLMVQMKYDRGSNIMNNFIGFGLSMDLPIFNRNSGNIKAAQWQIEEQKSTHQMLDNQLSLVVGNLVNQLNRLAYSLGNFPSQHLNEQTQMIENYKKHLQQKQITLLEFIDFIKAFREANKSYFLLQETYNKTLEELQYTAGKDF